MAKAKPKRPRFHVNDRITIAPYTPLIPAYGGKPFVGRETVLRVSSITGTGAVRNPWFVHVTDDAGHFWQMPPDDIVPAENEMHHATKKKSPRQLQREVNEILGRGRGRGRHHATIRECATWEPSASVDPLTAAKRESATEFERCYLVNLMQRAKTVSEAARLAGLDRTNFRRLLHRHGLRAPKE